MDADSTTKHLGSGDSDERAMNTQQDNDNLLADIRRTLAFIIEIGEREREKWKPSGHDGPWNAVLMVARESINHIDSANKSSADAKLKDGEV